MQIQQEETRSDAASASQAPVDEIEKPEEDADWEKIQQTAEPKAEEIPTEIQVYIGQTLITYRCVE